MNKDTTLEQKIVQALTRGPKASDTIKALEALVKSEVKAGKLEVLNEVALAFDNYDMVEQFDEAHAMLEKIDELTQKIEGE